MLYTNGIKSNRVYRKDHAVVFGIGGDSGVGKSTIMEDITQLLGARSVLGLEGDADHRWARNDQRWDRHTHLDPKANHLYRQADHLYLLKMGQSVMRADYCHKTGQFKAPEKIVPKDFIVVTGLHPFYLPKMRKNIDIKIYVDTEENVRLFWKTKRDCLERGYSACDVDAQIAARRDDSEKYILPQKSFADMVVRYFVPMDSAQDKEIGDGQALALCLTLNTEVNLEGFVGVLQRLDVAYEHEYAADLKNQYLTLRTPVPCAALNALVFEFVENIHEIVPGELVWQEGHRGFVQLCALLVLSEKMKMGGGGV